MKFSLLLLIATLSLVCGHVSITPNQVPSGTPSILNFQLSHGCNSTTLTNKVVVMVPSNITSIKPIDKVGWKLSRTAGLLGYKVDGVDAFYYNFTWEVDTNIYQGLPDWAFDVLSVRVTVPAAAAIAYGSKFTVPVWQHCTGGLTYAWISTSGSSGHDHAPAVNGVTTSTAPSFTVLNPTDIQFIPSQANVKSLVDRVANLTSTVEVLAANINTNPNPTSPPGSATTAPPVVTAGGNTHNYFSSSSSSWSRADTVAVISIILASLSVIASILLTLKLVALEKQNGQTNNTSVQLSKV